MIYKGNVLIEWNKNGEKTQDEVKVANEITWILNKYFADETNRRVRILYPRGEVKEVDNWFTVPKKFPIPLKSADGTWRYTSSLRTDKGFTEHHKYVKHGDILTEKDIEFIWFLKNRSVLLGKKVFIEDLEGEAAKEVNQMALDADIKFMLMSDRSPISKNEKLIRDIAEIFGIPKVSEKKFNQLKIDIYDAIVEGEEMNDRFVNYNTFDKLASGEEKRKAAFVARRAISDGHVKYRATDRSWWIASGNELIEKLITIDKGDVGDREEKFINAVIDDPNTKSRVFDLMGEQEVITLENLRELSRNVLQNKYKDFTGEFINKKKEEIIEELCKHYKIDYVSPT